MLSIRHVPLVAAFLWLGACKALDVPDLNYPSVDQLGPGASVAAITTAVQGLLSVPRYGIVGAGSVTATVSTLGGYGREGMNLDPSNPQGSVSTYVVIDPDAWYDPWLSSYKTMAQANVILKALPDVAGLTAAQKEGIAGFVQTMKAVVLFQVIRATDTAGAAPDAPEDPLGPLPPIQSKAQIYQRIAQLLDSAQTHLQAGGAAFAFTLPPGFTGFDTPMTFLTFNRGYKARLDVFAGDFTTALADLGASFLSTAAPLTLGTYFNFSTNSGDLPNGLYDPTTHQRYAHPSIWAGAQNKPDGTKDNRALAKVAPIPPLTRSGFTVSEKLTVYNSPSAPIPIIRNEELILLRAEANMGLGNRGAALTDINFIRQTSGGLAAISDPEIPAAE